MKNKKIVMVVILGLSVMLMLTGCGPKGGYIMLYNESSYKLADCRISMGNHDQSELKPGEWMKSGFDKNSMKQFNVKFNIDKNNKNDIVVDAPEEGSWSLIDILYSTYTSAFINVNDGETVIVTVRNK